jgi:hypothetical protein
MRRYRVRLREKNRDGAPPPRDLIRAYDDASAGEQRALARHILDTLLQQVKAPAAAPETTHKPDARQVDIEEAIAAAVAIEASAPSEPIAKPAKPAKPAGIWLGPMPAVIAREAEAQGIDAARLADLWERALVEKAPVWVAGRSTLSNVTKGWRRWLAHKLENGG